jgi:hypothetical protein
MDLDEKKIELLLIDSFENRGADELKEMYGLIKKYILPMYDCSPYHTSNRLHQMRKLLFIETLVQHAVDVNFKLNVRELMFASVCTELGLVKDEFKPLFRTSDLGIKSADILTDKFRWLLVDQFNYNPFSELNSIIPAIRYFNHPNTEGSTRRYYAPPLYATYLYDINHLSDLFVLGVDKFIHTYIHDYMMVDGININEEEDEDLIQRYRNRALINLNNVYGKAGIYTIESPGIIGNPWIQSKYTLLQMEIIKQKESEVK